MTKPSLTKLVKTYSAVVDDKTQDEWNRVCQKNDISLQSAKQKDYNQKNFKILIESIEANGIVNFNMTTFIAKISNYLENNPSLQVHEFEIGLRGNEKSKNSFSKTTQSFNCDSVGCIAGFATANALDWKQPKWLTDDSRNHVDFFENIACNWLNIPIEAGRKIFYGSESSVWSFVRLFEPQNYSQIQWAERNEKYDYRTVPKASPYDPEWDFYSGTVMLNSIHHKYAVDVLTRIKDGEIKLEQSNSYNPVYAKKIVKKIKSKQITKQTGDNNGNQ